MILGFSTQLNGKATYFVEKIHVGIKIENKVGLSQANVTPNYNFFVKSKCKPKIHTIRNDKKNRWKTGNKIDFFINVRKKDMFRFAPVLPVVSIQNFTINYEKDLYTEITRPTVWIDGLMFYDPVKRCDFGMLKLAQNDGFDSIADFFEYFNTDFEGKIIHWTNLKY